MKVRSISVNSFKGDTFRRIEILDEKRSNVFIPVIGIYKEKGQWHNDTNGRRFDTIKQAKDYAIDFYINQS